MIFLWGLIEDAPMKMVYEELMKAGADIFYLDHRDIFNCEIETTYNPDKGIRTILRNNERSLDLKEIKAAYIRPYDFRDYEEAKGKSAEDALVQKAAGFEAQLTTCLDTSNAFVVNKSMPSATNNSKPLQLSLIRRAGFNIPKTFITNDAAEARAFLSTYPDAVFKSVSGRRSIVEKVSAANSKHMNDVKWCPTLFQEVIPGNNYRVHVLKDEIFAVRIESDRLDYRYGNTTMQAEDLPDDIANKCRKITADLGLHLSGIDLMRTPDDKWYCFEVNPAPAFSYFQHNSGLPISAAIAKALMNTTANP
jgi:glutathione synthase/RimK-type ligase-like ATP-grasp enzyme